MITAKIKTKTPTIQSQKEKLGNMLVSIKDSVTEEMILAASVTLGFSIYTAKRYLKGKVANLKRGQQLYKELLKEIEKNAVAA